MLALLLLALADAPSVPAKADVVVEVELGELDLEVAGWTKEKVEVDADVGGGWSARLDESGGRVRVRFDGPPGIPTRGTVRLRMPKGAELQVSTRNGDVHAVDFGGRATIASIAGEVSVRGPAKQLEVATTSGAVEIAGADGRVDVATVNGRVQAANVGGDLHVETVSGRIEIAKAKLDRLELDTVSGDIEVGAELRKGPHRIDTNSGAVALTLPRSLALRIAIATFSGKIVDRFETPTLRTRGRHQRELGKGGGTLEVASFSGDVELSAKP
ncbi:MAG TPA: DUF4097 family beta strand repeat-containing protein [Nannocystaceae bacterium]|nr:DUF4097 family beta strand repeat-containing protein [Nannocystaceae bacterium]